jgi:hypothetical protein
MAAKLQTALTLVVLAVISAPTAVRADKCMGAKLKAVGTKEAGLLTCESKVAAKNDTSGLAACRSKVIAKFSAAFTKTGTCAGDQTRCEDLADACDSAMAAFLTDTVPSKCEAVKRKAAGRLASAELGCYAKAAKKNVPLDAACISTAEAKFGAALAAAGTCPDGGFPQNEVEHNCVLTTVRTMDRVVTDVCPTLGQCVCGWVPLSPNTSCPSTCGLPCTGPNDETCFDPCGTRPPDCGPEYGFCTDACAP